MDIRCKTCSKLFRIADEKISGKGIRFKCSQCGEVITLLKDEVERERLAREAPYPAKQDAQQIPDADLPPPPAAPILPEQSGQFTQKLETEEQAAKAHQPPQPSGLDDFDFSEPHAAAANADRQDEAAGGDLFADLRPEGQQEQGREISISDEDEKAAEEAFAFPADIISEPKGKALFESSPPIESGTDRPEAGGSHEPASASLSMPGTTVHPRVHETSPEDGPADAEDDDTIDLGAALAMPRSIAGSDQADGGDTREAPPATAFAADAVPHRINEVNPFASGSMTGAVAGMGCAIPVVLLMTVGLGLVTRFVPFLSSIPIAHLVTAAAAGIVGTGILLGILIAVVQAGAGKKLFFLANILLGAVFGAVLGTVIRTSIQLLSGEGLSVASLVSDAIAWGAMAFVLSSLVALARRAMVHAKEETFAAPMSGPQKAGFALSLLVFLVALYSQGTLTGRIEHAAQESAQQLQQYRQEMTPEGLTVANAAAHIDPESGDLVITGDVRNTLDRQKPGWYLEIEVYDGVQNVLTTVRIVNGVQLFSRRDYEILEKRGKNVDEIKTGIMLAVRTAVVPANGSVGFEARLFEPPAGASAFLPFLRPFDPASIFTEMADPMKD